jgi:hypothetical protein
MKYNKLIYFVPLLIIVIFFLFVKIIANSSRIKVIVETDKIDFSSSTVKIPIKIFAIKDSVFHISFYLTEKNVKQKIFNDYIIALKKGQDYDLICEFNNDILKEKNTFLFLTKLDELLPDKKERLYSVLIKKPVEVVKTTLFENMVSISTPSKVVVPEEKKLVKEEKVVSEEKKEEKIVIKEKPDFEIVISSERFKKKYKYDEKIEVIFFVKNKTATLQIKPKIDVVLKTKFETVVSSQTFNVQLLPLETKSFSVEFDILKDFLAGNYYIELVGVLNNVKHVVNSEDFEIVDFPPRISFPETPVIRYKLANTILVEVEDDKEVTEVKFVEVIPKKKTINEYQIITESPMILVAGNKKAGLYSYTTSKILKKDFYTFYIQAKDSSENITKTEVFKIKITK